MIEESFVCVTLRVSDIVILYVFVGEFVGYTDPMESRAELKLCLLPSAS